MDKPSNWFQVSELFGNALSRVLSLNLSFGIFMRFEVGMGRMLVSPFLKCYSSLLL